jgi:hypothetical protein
MPPPPPPRARTCRAPKDAVEPELSVREGVGSPATWATTTGGRGGCRARSASSSVRGSGRPEEDRAESELRVGRVPTSPSRPASGWSSCRAEAPKGPGREAAPAGRGEGGCCNGAARVSGAGAKAEGPRLRPSHRPGTRGPRGRRGAPGTGRRWSGARAEGGVWKDAEPEGRRHPPDCPSPKGEGQCGAAAWTASASARASTTAPAAPRCRFVGVISRSSSGPKRTRLRRGGEIAGAA